MIQHPAVHDIVQKRQAYQTAKAQFLTTLFSDPTLTTLSPDALDSFLLLAIQDEELCQDIRQYAQAGRARLAAGTD